MPDPATTVTSFPTSLDPSLGSVLPATSDFSDQDLSVLPASAPTPNMGKKPSPLDVLDEILNEAQEKTDAFKKELEEKEAAKLAEEKLARELANQQMIAAAAEQIEAAKQSPQYLAKLAQDDQVKSDEQLHAQELSGMSINQLKHSTV